MKTLEFVKRLKGLLDTGGGTGGGIFSLASCTQVGGVRPDGKTCKVDADGNLTVIGLNLTDAELERNNPTPEDNIQDNVKMPFALNQSAGTTRKTYTIDKPGQLLIEYRRRPDVANVGMGYFVKNGVVFHETGMRDITTSSYATMQTPVSVGDVIEIYTTPSGGYAATWEYNLYIIGRGPAPCSYEPIRDFIEIGEITVGSAPGATAELDVETGKYKLNLSFPHPQDFIEIGEVTTGAVPEVTADLNATSGKYKLNFTFPNPNVISATGILSASYTVTTPIVAQEVLTLPDGLSYSPGNNSLLVYVGGFKMVRGVDYAEVSATSIRLLAPVSAGLTLDFLIYS